MFDGVVEARGVEAGIVMPILKQARPILASRRRYILSSGAVRVCRRAKVRSTTTVSGGRAARRLCQNFNTLQRIM